MELLRDLYCIHSASHKEKPMIDFIAGWVTKNVPGAIMSADKIGNIYIKKGSSETYPCLVAHTDQVQSAYPKDYVVIRSAVHISAIDCLTRKTCGLGADDKNGIWIALKALKKYPALKVALFVSEETGCVGSNQADMQFFDDCRWVVECDRKGHQDFINRISGVDLCNRKFIDDANIRSHKYSCQDGLMTDVLTLKRKGLKVCCCNMSCGYYEPHTDREYTVIPDLLKCQRLVEHMIEKMTNVYRHEYKPTTFPYRNYGYRRADFMRTWSGYPSIGEEDESFEWR